MRRFLFLFLAVGLFTAPLVGCGFMQRRADAGPDGIIGTPDDGPDKPSGLEDAVGALDALIGLTPWAGLGAGIGVIASGVSSLATSISGRRGKP